MRSAMRGVTAILLGSAIHWLSALAAQTPSAPGTTTPGTPPAAAAAQRPQARTGTSVIRGRVLADGGAPLVRAEVRLGGLPVAPGGTAPSTITDEQGRYELTNLPAGRFTLTASKSGYLVRAFGQTRSSEAPRSVDVGEAQTVERIDITLPKGGTIVVRLTDDLGGPIAGVAVRADQYRIINGQRTLVQAGLTVETDDRGDARLRGMAQGDYYVSANAAFFGRGALLDSTSSRRLYAQTYFPGAASAAEAQPVTVGLGQEVTASFSLVPVRAARISGVVRASDGSVPRTASILFTVPNFSSNIPMRPDGSFSISNVVPGDVTISVRPSSQPAAVATQEFGRVSLKVTGEDVSDLVITTSKGSAVRGRLVFDTGAPPAGVRPGFVQVGPQFIGQATAVGAPPIWQDDWTFELTGLVGSALIRLRPALPPAPTGTGAGWLLKAVTLEGRDVTDVPFELNGKDIAGLEVVLTQKRTLLSGTVRDVRGVPVPDPIVVVFPESREQRTPQSRFISVGRPDQEGRFSVAGLPPGRYLAAAVGRLEPGQERDPDVLALLETRATRLTLAEGESKTVDLTFSGQ